MESTSVKFNLARQECLCCFFTVFVCVRSSATVTGNARRNSPARSNEQSNRRQPCLSPLGPRWQRPASTWLPIFLFTCTSQQWSRDLLPPMCTTNKHVLLLLTVFYCVFYKNVSLRAPVLPTDVGPIVSKQGANVPKRTHRPRWAHKREDNHQDWSAGQRTIQ